MAQSKIDGDLIVGGALTPANFNPPANSITNTAIAAAAGVEATKLKHQHSITYKQDDGAAVANAIVPIWTCRGVAATVVAVEVVCIDAPSGGALTFSVDLLVCDVAVPVPATILAAVVTYPFDTPDCTVRPGTVASPTLADGDTLVVQVTVAGAGGVQGEGLIVTVTIREDAE